MWLSRNNIVARYSDIHHHTVMWREVVRSLGVHDFRPHLVRWIPSSVRQRLLRCVSQVRLVGLFEDRVSSLEYPNLNLTCESRPNKCDCIITIIIHYISSGYGMCCLFVPGHLVRPCWGSRWLPYHFGCSLESSLRGDSKLFIFCKWVSCIYVPCRAGQVRVHYI